MLGYSSERGARSWSSRPCTGTCDASSAAIGLGAGILGPCSGLNALRNLRFLSVTLPLPSTFTEYLSKPLSSRTRLYVCACVHIMIPTFLLCPNHPHDAADPDLLGAGQPLGLAQAMSGHVVWSAVFSTRDIYNLEIEP